MPRTLRRVVVFVAGLALIVVGLVLIVLPGPLTIPPILLGVWLWSREFEFARRWLRPIQARAAAAWDQAKRAPARTTLVTVVGLVGAVAVIWAVFRFDLIDRGRQLVGLG
ncbi:MAG TPA: PGPGW domain-containing protein [Nocardioides sp.]|jgi:uncharacterized membrane protein YbaN (DUF454 family)|uniref:PGPGW domain-containing protein n=1 Tax=Nocardioides sp. TaxID=35761 RepID=UPI002E30122A|nr:PGPGW domain-containing protein [Nocardioides sp.]HEX3931678.1 PGPGW domain-containing protein [Nocardioides sp.]